ncbi:MAG TPA: ATP-binding protein [Puia sp.]|jgi:two-component system NtrC family sensor kinase|nr:ATP-binding protein [Puia sp.]
MKKFSFLLVTLFTLYVATAQQSYLDSLKQRLTLSKNQDTSRVLALFSLADYYGFIQFDSCLFYAAKTSELSQKLNYPFGKFLGYWSTFHGLNSQGNYAKALEAAINMEKIADEIKKERPWIVPQVYYFLGVLNFEMAEFPEAKIQFHISMESQKNIGEAKEETFASYSQLGNLYLRSHKLDSALIFAQQGYDLGLGTKRFKIYFPLAIAAIGNVNAELGKFDLARHYFHEAIEESERNGNIYFQVINFNNLARMYYKMKITDSSIYYAEISLQLSQAHKFDGFTIVASTQLAQSFELENKRDSTLKYLKMMVAVKDSVFSQSKVKEFQQSTFNEIQRQQEISIAKERYQNQVRTYVLIASLIVFFLIAFILYRNNRQKQKDKLKIEKAYSELKLTQAQLIQSEKMASLGELTAGIAHEIQNPLNFVNNFSELNTELLMELKDEIKKGDVTGISAIADDIIENEQKINHHGKRADAIVKGMLQHSRSSTGVKESTDINALAEEYLRLAYHGLRGKDNSFSAAMKTDFDNNIGKINIIPQDIGRVLLNLYNNAFYAVGERRKTEGLEYEPAILVSTKKINDKIVLTVMDNGNGIPQKAVDKIFQPFFTTKPTGQGTGLGLSLSYDIIKSHGGEIKAETKENEGTTFIIQLPVV